MRKIFYSVGLLLCMSFACCQSGKQGKSYTITGSIVNAKDGDTVMLQMDNEQNLIVLEKTVIKNGSFEFTGKQDSTVERIITYKKNGTQVGALFFLENGNIHVVFDETTSITGTENNDKYQAFLNQINGIYGQMSSVNDIHADSTFTDSIHTDLNEKVQQLDQKANDLILKTIKENIDNPIGFYLFKKYNYIIEPKLQYHLISKMPVSWRRATVIEDIKTQLDLLPADSIGSYIE